MIEHIFSAVCSRTSVDSDTNSVSLFNIVEQINIYSENEIPGIVPIYLEIFSEWVRSENSTPCSGKIRIFICDPNNKCKQQAELAIDLRQATFFRTRVRSNAIEYKGPGRYTFTIELLQDNNST